MIIAFIGNDGSGKSSVSKNFLKFLDINKNNNIKINEFEYFFLNYFKKFFAKKINNIQLSIQDVKKKSLTKKIFPYIVWIDLFVEYYFRKFFQKNKIIIKDRYAYDFLMTWREQKISSKVIEFLYFNFPKPDLIFFIYVSPNIARERRILQKENLIVKPINFYKKKTEMYIEFCNKKNIIKINNENSIKETLKKVAWHFETKISQIEFAKT